MILPKHGSTVYSDFPVMKHIVSWIDLVENLQETFKYDQISDIPISAMIWFEHSLQKKTYKNDQKRMKPYVKLREIE